MVEVKEIKTLKPGERHRIIKFDKFRRYKVKVLKRDMVNVGTFTSRKPISEWALRGLIYIDEQTPEGIRDLASVSAGETFLYMLRSVLGVLREGF